MTNPIFEHLPPGPQRDEAEAESQMATARETIVRLERERDEARAKISENDRARDELEAARDAIGEEWLVPGESLAQAIRRRVSALQELVDEERKTSDLMRCERDAAQARCEATECALAEQRAIVRQGKQPSGNPGEIETLSRRIAIADAKHPRDLEDGEASLSESVARLNAARRTLGKHPSWKAAFLCEVREVLVELAKGDMGRLAEELRGVATLCTRWARAIEERGL